MIPAELVDQLLTMSDGELLAWMGSDGRRWAIAFDVAASRGAPADEDERVEWLVGWFANAIEAGRSKGQVEML